MTEIPRGGAPMRVGQLVPNIESRPAPCPRGCGNESREIRYAPPPGLSEELRKRLDPERPFVAQACESCHIAELQHVAESERRRARETAVGMLAVPAQYTNVTVENFEVYAQGVDRPKQARAQAFARDFVRLWPNVPMISTFAGTFGSGKGHLMWAIARELAAQHAVVTRVHLMSDIIRHIRESWGKEATGPSEARRLSEYRLAPMLIIDEISRHNLFSEPHQHLYDIVAAREIALRPTILTTNERGVDLAEILGPALSSRAAAWDGFVDFGDTDWRLARGHRRRTA